LNARVAELERGQHWLKDLPFFREQIANATVQTPYGDGLPAPWTFLSMACDCVDALANRVAELEAQVAAQQVAVPVDAARTITVESELVEGGLYVIRALPHVDDPEFAKGKLQYFTRNPDHLGRLRLWKHFNGNYEALAVTLPEFPARLAASTQYAPNPPHFDSQFAILLAWLVRQTDVHINGECVATQHGIHNYRAGDTGSF
jgi:hypothetical protein